jgi:rare lipoprotein A
MMDSFPRGRAAASKMLRTICLGIALGYVAGCAVAPRVVPGPEPIPEPVDVAEPGPTAEPAVPGPLPDSGTRPRTTPKRQAGAGRPRDLAKVPDAVPRREALSVSANRPYVVYGEQFVPMTLVAPFRQRGLASWYGPRFHGNRTANGEVYDMYAMTAAHPTLPIPSFARVTHVASGRTVIVRINDRGPFRYGRSIDLSYAAAYRLGIAEAGVADVAIEQVTLDEIPDGATRYAAQQVRGVTVALAERGPASGDVDASAQVCAMQDGQGPTELGRFATRELAQSMMQRLAAREASAVWIGRCEGSGIDLSGLAGTDTASAR